MKTIIPNTGLNWRDLYRPLSKQEKNVLFLLLQGYSLPEIMDFLDIKYMSQLYCIGKRINKKYKERGVLI